ncbi:hypothetical protein [Salinibacterium sp. ZJ454]|uniref:hypothetical protein n=1 Tax=Salinibacterium sp. ZJ454 TaxID=2708339 RepID=UPI001422FDAA|nr:hypothetical protein [Salinibacterium sp. ZJ454]
MVVSRAALSDDARARILNAEIARYAARGWQVQSITTDQAVLSKNKRIGWFWNIVLTFFTFGLWMIVVIARLINRKRIAILVTVGPSGTVRIT